MFDEDPTKRYKTVASILLASNDAKQVATCKSLADQLGVYFKHCELDEVAETAAQWRPFALLVSEQLHDAATRSNVEQVARECHATTLVLKDDLGEGELGRSLMPTLKQLLRQQFE